jgi:hypothetical protein
MTEDTLFLDGDFQETATADVVMVEGGENIERALRRRLTTPQGDLFYDTAYGNPVFELLGEDITEDLLTRAKLGIRDCVNQDSRVVCPAVEATVQLEQRRVLFHIRYQILGEQEVRAFDQPLELR